MTASNDLELDLATMDALRGAEDVRRRLLLEMSTGTPAISDLAYAVKVRVKEDFKVVGKVLRKRKDGRAHYEVASLRDLVGLRIVTLYRLDALEILPILLERLQTGSREPDSVFSRRGIEEIIIYSTNPTGDAQDLPGRVEALCQAFHLSDRTKTEQTPQNYTSIHIVVWCRGKYQGAYRDIPVEIQMRTAFEDVWGEIDHSLKYKRASEDEALDRASASRLELNEAHLNVMKTLIDGLAQYGDQIKLQMEGDKRILASSSRRSEQAVDRLAAMAGLDSGVRHLVEAVVGTAQEALDADLPPNAGRAARRRVAGDLIRTGARIDGMNLRQDHLKEVRYVLEMERALLLFEVGNELREAGGNASLVEASRIYMAMTDQFPERVVPIYRLARTLDELGDKPAALGKYRAAVEALPSSDLAPDHWLRGTAPRLLGFACWEEAMGRLRAPRDATERADALGRLLEAVELTKRSVEASIADAGELGKARNNLLYFILDYRAVGGSNAALAELGINDATVRTLVSDLEEQAGDDVARWDTVRCAHEGAGDGAAAVRAARRILELLQTPQRRERWTTNEGIIQRDALQTIETLGEGGKEGEAT